MKRRLDEVEEEIESMKAKLNQKNDLLAKLTAEKTKDALAGRMFLKNKKKKHVYINLLQWKRTRRSLPNWRESCRSKRLTH